MTQGPIEEVVAELGFSYDTAVFVAMDAQINLMIGAIEILGRTAQAVSDHMVRVFKEAGLPVENLERSSEQLADDLDGARREAAKLRREFGKTGDAADETGDAANELGDDIESGAERGGLALADLAKGAGLVAIAMKAIDFAHEFAETARQVRILSQSMGVSVEAASEWTAVARTVGAEAEDIQDAMVTLSERFLDAANGGADARDMLKRLGLEIPKTAGEIPDAEEGLLQLADAFAAIENPAERAAKASELLGDNGVRLLPFLSRGRRGIEDMRRRVRELGGGLSSEGIANMEKFQGALVFVQVALESLFDVFAKKFLPILTDVVDQGASVLGWFQGAAENSRFLESLLVVLGAGFGAFAVQAAAAWFAALWPIALIVGGVLLLVAAIDDLWTGLEGGESLIGRVLDDAFGDGTAAEFFDQLREGWQEVLAWLEGTALPFLVGMWENIKPSIDAVMERARSFVDGVMEAVGPLAHMLVAMWTRIREPVTQILGFVARAVRALVTFIFEGLAAYITSAMDTVQFLIEQISAGIQFVADLLERAGITQLLGEGLDRVGNFLEQFNFGSDGDRVVTQDEAKVDAEAVTGASRRGGQQVTQTNNVNLELNLPPGVTPDEARRLAREAARGAMEERDEALLQGLEATA